MTYKIELTEDQENGLAVKLQEFNAQRIRPVLVDGKPKRLPQLTAEAYVQAAIEELASAGCEILRQHEQADLLAQFAEVMSDPVKKAAFEASVLTGKK